LRELFDKFVKLERVDLGILPTVDENEYALLRKDLEERGVKVSWRVCRLSRWCDDCQDEHD
jgi:hypothetical protein